MLNEISYLCSMDQISTFRSNIPQVIAVFIKNMMLLTFGLAQGFPTMLIAGLIGSNEFKLTSDDITWLGSTNLLFIPVGSLLSGFISQKLGRKRSMLFSNIPLFFIWLLLRFSTQLWQIYLGLALSGILHGFIEAPTISYVAEITTPQLRGILCATASMSVIIGILVQWVLGTFYPWRHCALLSAIFPVISFNLLFIAPESPRWLLAKGRIIDAKRSLAWLRGWTSLASIEKEFKAMEKELSPNTPITNIAQIEGTKISDYFKKDFLWPFSVVMLTFFIMHFSGITNLGTYAVEIFSTFQAPIDQYYSTLILGVANILGCVLCVTLIRYTGKRILNFFSMFLCAIFAITIACYAYYHGITELKLTVYKFDNISSSHGDFIGMDSFKLSHWIPTGCLLCFSFFSHVGIRLLPWILTGELYSNKTRSIAAGLSGALGYILAFATNKLFLILVNFLTLPGMFFMYGSLLLLGLFLLYFLLPETEGKSLQEITEHYSGGKKIGNWVNRRKRSQHNDDLWYVNMNFSDSMYYNLDNGDIDCFD